MTPRPLTRSGSALLIAFALGAVMAASAAGAQHTPFDSLARASLAPLDGRVLTPGVGAEVEIIRDRWGVPHIYASSIDDLFFAQGYVQAQDRLWQMEMYRRTYEGTLSEIMGPDYVAHDRLARLLKFRGPFDDAEWKHYHPEGRRIFDAFAAGVNAYIREAERANRLPVEFVLTGIRPRPWTAEVALLRTQTAMPIADARAELRLARDVARLGADSANALANPSPSRPLVVPRGLDLAAVTDDAIEALGALRTGTVRPPLLPRYRAMHDALPSANRGVQENSPGSNNWVLSGRLTASGSVIVANDPHRAVTNPSIRYLVHLVAPGWNVIGATEPVWPGVMIGHTESIAWGLTIVGTDQADVYVEELNPANHREVRFRGTWEPLRVEVDTIRVKGAAPVVVTHRFSRHGPVFHVDTVRHVAFAMRTTAHLPGSAGYLSALRYHALRDCREFLDAQVYWLAPTENMLCGDVHGNIAWQASAASPKRAGWDGRLPVPGTGEYEWDGLRTNLPRELNPERGWIATANHDIHPPGYDPPLFFKRGPSRARYDRIADVLSSGRRFTLEDMTALQHDAYASTWPRDSATIAAATLADPLLEELRRELARWDGQHRRESRAAAVYHYAARMLHRGAPARALRLAVDSLRARQGRDPSQWRWGRINRSELPHALVRAYDIPSVERHGGAGFVAAVGATFREVVDMGKLDSALATNAPGQSGQPRSPFYANLVEAYGRGEYFPMVFSRAAVDAAAAHRLVLVPAGVPPGR